MIASEDIKLLENSGRSLELILRQLEHLKNGIPPLENLEVARVGNGIFQLSDTEIENALKSYSQEDGSKKWSKFVPASGAASRMFAYLYEYLEAASDATFDEAKYKENHPDIAVFIDELKCFPFFNQINTYVESNKALPPFKKSTSNVNFVKAMILSEHFGYGKFPKGLLPFFSANDGSSLTPFEAQLLESISLFPSGVPIEVHFTISQEHQGLFNEKEAAFRKRLTPKVNHLLTIEYSYQNDLTDTPVLDEKDEWIRDDEGALLFRKGGHGALLENLNSLDADKLWIKNIDNIQMGDNNEDSLLWQKILGGYLTHVQNQLFDHLKSLEENQDPNLDDSINFIKTYFNEKYTVENSEDKPIKQKLIDYLDRPLRICAMIKNEGAAGGGPLWEDSSRGRILQIVEGIELDEKRKDHQPLIAGATHFNPVLIACGITNSKGEKYPLFDFRNQNRYMVVNKTIEGKKIKSLEWPGLWNGGMSHWNSIFIEVPPTTFRPVKKLNDILT